MHQDADPALLRSEQYIAIGCDLADIHKLNTIVTNEVDSETCSTLFLAEVSLTYMDLTAADALLKWASLLNDCMSDATQLNLTFYFIILTCLSSILPTGANLTQWASVSIC